MAFETGRLDLRAALAEMVRRMPDMWRGAGGVLALAAVVAIGIAVSPLTGPGRTALLIFMAVILLAAFGAVTRVGVASDLNGARRLGLGPAGFQLGRPELRLAGAVLLCALFMLIILSLLALVALALFGAAGLDAGAVRARDWAAVGPAWKLGLLALVGLVVLGTPVLLLVRLSLFAQATVGRDRMISLGATALTNGAMLPLLAGLVVCTAPMILWILLTAAGLLSGEVALIGGVVVPAAIQAPLTAAFLGAAYRQLEHGTRQASLEGART